MRLCLPARMGGGGKTANRCPGAGQRAQPATRGRLFAVWERGGKAPGVPPARIAAAIRTDNGTLARRDAARRSARAPVRQRPPGKERGKSACGSAQKRRAPRSAQRGTERVLQQLPLIPTCSRSSPEWAGTTGPVRAADRAGRPQGQHSYLSPQCRHTLDFRASKLRFR